jgi:hypothetical protein
MIVYSIRMADTPSKEVILSADRLCEVLSYDPVTGFFVWKSSGKRAGNKAAIGYRSIRIDYVSYYEHRLAWFYTYGVWPDDFVDHINQIKDDNRIENLRNATRSQNYVNSKVTRASSGMKGVYSHENTRKWRARFINEHLGYFDTKKEARAAYKVRAIELFGEFAETQEG